MAVSEKRHAVPVSGSSDAVEQTDVSVDVPIAKEDETSAGEKKSGSPYLVSNLGKMKDSSRSSRRLVLRFSTSANCVSLTNSENLHLYRAI